MPLTVSYPIKCQCLELLRLYDYGAGCLTFPVARLFARGPQRMETVGANASLKEDPFF